MRGLRPFLVRRPDRRRRGRRPADPGVPASRILRLVLALAGLILVVAFGGTFPGRARPAPPSKSCAEQRGEILRDIDKLSARSPSSAPALAEVRALVEAGEVDRANAAWKAARGEEPAEVLLDTKLFLLSVCAPGAEAIDSG